MKVEGKPTRTIWPVAGLPAGDIIDQTALPHAFCVRRLARMTDAVQAIRGRQVRGTRNTGFGSIVGLLGA